MFIDVFDRRTGAPRVPSVWRDVNAIFDALERPTTHTPRLSVEQDDTSLTLSLVAPGVAADDIEVTLTGRRLDLNVRREPTAPEGFRAVRQERRNWTLERSFELPFDVEDDVEARLARGVFTLTLTKVPTAEPKRITVHTEEAA